MSEVKRYLMEASPMLPEIHGVKHPQGKWVLYSDCAELEAENRDGRQAFSDLMNTTDIIRAELEAEVTGLKKKVSIYEDWEARWSARVDREKARIAKLEAEKKRLQKLLRKAAACLKAAHMEKRLRCDIDAALEDTRGLQT